MLGCVRAEGRRRGTEHPVLNVARRRARRGPRESATEGKSKEAVATVEYRDASRGTLAVGVFEDGEHRVIRVGGELDLATAETLKQELDEAMKPADEAAIVIDLSDLEFIDSTGIAILIRAMGDGTNGSSRLRFVPSRAEGVNRVLAMTGVAERMHLAEGIRQ